MGLEVKTEVTANRLSWPQRPVIKTYHAKTWIEAQYLNQHDQDLVSWGQDITKAYDIKGPVNSV